MQLNKSKYFILFSLVFFHYLLGYFNYEYSIEVKNTDAYFLYNQIITEERTLQELASLGSSFFVAFNKLFRVFNFFWFSFLYSTLTLVPYLYMFFIGWYFFIRGNFFYKILYLLLLFLPSCHYWLASFTKDAFCFFAIFIILKYFFSQKKTYLHHVLVFVIFVLMTLMRPYLGVISLVVLAFFIKRKYIYTFISVFIVSLFIFLSMFLNLEEISIDAVLKKYEFLNIYGKVNGNSSIDLFQTNMFSRFFMITFRPLFFDAITFNQYIVSLENSILIVVFLLTIYQFCQKPIIRFRKTLYMSLGIYAIILWLFYSTYIYNYGLASRMKAAYIIYLLYFIYMVLSTSHKKID